MLTTLKSLQLYILVLVCIIMGKYCVWLRFVSISLEKLLMVNGVPRMLFILLLNRLLLYLLLHIESIRASVFPLQQHHSSFRFHICTVISFGG